LAFTNLAIALSDIQITYRSDHEILNVLKGVSLFVPQGEIFGVIGRSGTGKSTLLRCLNGLETPDSGEILIHNKSLLKATHQERCKILSKVGTVFQEFNLLSRRTVLQNIALPLEFAGASADEITVKSTEIAALVGLSDKHSAYPSQLSGGQSQRVAIARALASNVSLLLCDEFTSSLDPETTIEILSLLQDLNRRLGITIVLVTHDMSVISEICNHVCVLDSGKVVEIGPTETILLNPQHKVTHSLVSHLFAKDLPRVIHETLRNLPLENDHAVLRLTFSSNATFQPTIAAIIQTFGIPINILTGNTGHIREMTFGSLIVTLPINTTLNNGHALLEDILAYFQMRHIAVEVLGFIPPL